MIRSCSSRNAANDRYALGVWRQIRGWRGITLVWHALPEWGLSRPVRPPETGPEGSKLAAQGSSR